MKLSRRHRHIWSKLGPAMSTDVAATSDDASFYAAKPCPPTAIQRALIALARNSFLHRGKMRHLMTRLIMRVGGDRPLDTHFRDCTYRIAGTHNLVEYGILLHPNYNGPDLDFLLGGLHEGGIALDVGANIGLYTLPLARAVGPSGRVIAIDANPAMIRGLAWNAQASGLENVSLHATAVGGHEGRVELYARDGDVAIVNVRETSDGSYPMRSLASIVAEEKIDRIDVLKIDIEGYEDKALVPFLETAQGALLPKRIVIEHDRGADHPGCKAVFDRIGFRLMGRTKQNSLYQRARATA